MSKIKKLSTLLLFLMIMAWPGGLSAQESEMCGGSSSVQMSAFVPVTADTPNIFAKAGRSEDAVRARLYFQTLSIDNTGACVMLGETDLTTYQWKPLGRLAVDGEQQAGNLILALDSVDYSQAGASSPQIIFAGDLKPCELVSSCTANYQGKQFHLSPKKISANFDTLRVGQLLPIENDATSEVIYSLDGKQVYSSKQIEDFNFKFVPGGKHTLERTVILESGQTLSDSQTSQRGTFGEPIYYMTALYSRYTKLIVVIGSILAVISLWAVVLAIARWLYARRQWRLNHIAGLRAASTTKNPFDNSVLTTLSEHRKLTTTALLVLIGIVLTYSYVITNFTVDGVSMNPTLQDKSQRALFLLPASIGKISGGGYAPSRGAIVVIKKSELNLFDTSLDTQDSYVVKRVVGLPGDRVVIRNGVITIYNQDRPEGFVPDEEYSWITDRTGSEYFRSDITLEENELFVIGDNRDESIDSRFYGPIESAQVVGKVL